MFNSFKAMVFAVAVLPAFLLISPAHADDQQLYEARTAMELGDYEMAARIYENLVSQGEEAAVLPLARIHRQKLIRLAHPERALTLVHDAATRGYAPAQTRLGYLYETGQGLPKDFKRAWYWYVQASGQDEPEAITAIGLLYQHGRGVRQDFETARKWFDRAATIAHHPAAEHALGFLYEQGLGVERSLDYARSWYQLAADQGYTPSMNILGFMYEMGYGTRISYDQALHWYRQSANAGDAAGQNALGGMYLRGHGVRRNALQAQIWINKAAEQGYAEAQFNLASLYLQGKGTQKDLDAAVKWLKEGANNGHPKALYTLASLYEKGTGVTQNREHARKLYTMAANAKLAEAEYAVGRLDEEDGRAREALKWYLRAANQGYTQGQASAGVLYEMGHGTDQNLARALFWYNLAAADGDMASIRHRNRLAEALDQRQREQAGREAADFEPHSLALTLQRQLLISSSR